jgi:hypothetical protein
LPERIATPESAASIAEGLTVNGGGTLRNAFALPLTGDPGLGVFCLSSQPKSMA